MSIYNKSPAPSIFTITALLLKLAIKGIEKPLVTALDCAENFAHIWAHAAKFPSFLYSRLGDSTQFISQCLTPKSLEEYHEMVKNLRPIEKFSAKESGTWTFLKYLAKALGGEPTPVWYLKNLPDITELGNNQISYGRQKYLKSKTEVNIDTRNYLDNGLTFTITKDPDKPHDRLIGPDMFYKTEEDFVRSALHEEIDATWKDSSQKIKYESAQGSMGFFATIAHLSYTGSEVFEYTAFFPAYMEKGWHAYKEALCSYTESEKAQSVKAREAQKIESSNDQNTYVVDVFSDQKLSGDPTWFTH